jgi:IS5 family transposase
MVRRHYAQLTLSQLILFGVLMPSPEELMDPQLRRIDGLLDDEALVNEVLEVLRRRRPQSARRGRPGTPAEVMLRMLVLKHVRQWSFERLCWEVTGNVAYRQFCRVGAEKVPDDKTVIKLNQLLEGAALQRLFARVVELSVERGVTRGKHLRLDTTVVEAPMHYPSDSRLCEDGVRVLRRGLARLGELGVVLSKPLVQVSRSVSRRMREIKRATKQLSDEGVAQMKKSYRGLLRIVGRLVRQTEEAVSKAPGQLQKLVGKAKTQGERVVEQLRQKVSLVRQVIRQTRARVFHDIVNLPGKVVSLLEPYAQIFSTRKPGRSAEFGVRVLVQESEGGIVGNLSIEPGRNDAPLLEPAVARHVERFGRVPHRVATDRGFWSGPGEKAVQQRGVKRAVIPRRGGKSKERLAHERQRWFRRGRAWRTGGEGRISRLKHTFGMARSRYKGFGGMVRTVFWAGFANNLAAIAAKAA